MAGLPADDRYIIISADTHAGANHATYREYLDSRYHEEFDAWRGRYKNPFRDLQDDGRTRNWDTERRNRDQEADGIVGEVIFPNTVPPFFPTGAPVARPPRNGREYELRLAGIRAHNRWLADFCAEQPERRAGIGQIFLNDLDDAIEDVKFIAEHGLRGGALLPAIPPDMQDELDPLYSPAYDKLWAACQDYGVILNHHSSGGAGPDYGRFPASGLILLTEVPFFSRRAMTHLIMSGVFERFPGLKLVLTENGASWVPETLRQLDGHHDQMVKLGRVGELGFPAEIVMPMKPSEYFARNVWIGASFPSPSEAASRHAIGIDKFMWGSDYPHHEASSPYSREAIRRSFAGTDPVELQQVLAGNAAKLYGFDLDKLAPVAAKVGPTIEELATPLDTIPADATSPAFYRA